MSNLLFKIIEFIIKIWISLLILIVIVGWLTIVIATIINPNIWDNVQFGLIDTLGD
jgi:hypothetical protein